MPYLKVGSNKFQKDDRIFKEKVKIFIAFVQIPNGNKKYERKGI